MRASQINCSGNHTTNAHHQGVCRRQGAARPQLQPAKAIAGVRVSQPQIKPQWSQQASVWRQNPTGLPSVVVQRPPRPVAQPTSAAVLQQLTDDLPDWAARFRRQVQSLPQGEAALVNLLHAVEQLLVKTEHCGSHKAVLRAYIMLGLIDLVAQAWQQRTAELQANPMQHQRQLIHARLALAGCRYLRIETSKDLGRQLHILVDDEGYSPVLNLSNLPAPHALGLPVAQLLRQGLGVDLAHPAIRASHAPAATLSNLSWEDYEHVSADTSMCGDWLFCYWVGDATWVPAPYGKFSTPELVALLTPATILTSLANGIWGRALVTAAHEYGLSLDCGNGQQQQYQYGNNIQPLQASGSGMNEAMKHLLEESIALPAKGVRARVRQFSVAVAQARAAMLGPAAVGVAGAQGH